MAPSSEIPRAHGSYEALLADPEVDAVYIGLPNGLHPEWTVRAAGAGSTSCARSRRRAPGRTPSGWRGPAREAGVILMEAFMCRLHPQHARVLELIRGGAIGEPVFVRATFCFAMARAAGGPATCACRRGWKAGR